MNPLVRLLVCCYGFGFGWFVYLCVFLSLGRYTSKLLKDIMTSHAEGYNNRDKNIVIYIGYNDIRAYRTNAPIGV